MGKMAASWHEFEGWFTALTDVKPFPWQRRLFARLVKGDLPRALNLPTGTGKTSVLLLWLLARAAGAPVPCRLVYVVNRRTVVDQATETVAQVCERLRSPEDSRWAQHKEALSGLHSKLAALCSAPSSGDPLGVSTLRGELADNQEWKADPARAAIVVGTVDMIGSKLLFSGYGDGPYHRAQHAGLIGQDVLLVHDEAHLTPAFSELLRGLVAAQRRAHELRRLHTLELSATQRDSGESVFGLDGEDEHDPVISERLDAAKHLKLHAVNERDLTARLVELATRDEADASRVLVYVHSPERAREVERQLRRRLGSGADDCVALLTGTIRGYERDQLVKTNVVYRSLLDRDPKLDRCVYLVSTSAGEVGTDLDADHMVCDLTTLDAMIQRLGRVNRRGGRGRAASVDVVIGREERIRKQAPNELEIATQHTETILRQWVKGSDGAVDLSPRRLRELLARLGPEERCKAFSPSPDMQPVTDILLDAWSMTSTDGMAGHREVASYLHGLTRDPLDTPDTYVAWRKEVKTLDEASVSEADVRYWFRACRVQAQERLRDQTERVRRALADLLKRHRKADPERDFPVVLLDERGDAKLSRLSQVLDKRLLQYRTVVLPVEAGGLSKPGMLDPSATAPRTDLDVAEEMRGGDVRRERCLCRHTPEGETCKRLLTGEVVDLAQTGLREQARVILREETEEVEGAGQELALVLMVSPAESVMEEPQGARTRQSLAQHSSLAAEHMQRMAQRLGLCQSLQDALVTAARWHDQGKDRELWQHYACNEQGLEPLAKSPRYRAPRLLGGYRHEFGSLLDAEACQDIRNHPERDLVLHLIAAHHGWARPHFEPQRDSAHTPAENRQASLEVMRRFGRLQQRFGRWGLAWLESLLRCADIAASQAAAAGTEGPAGDREEHT
jgi:CRISPR-associated endonuclease/helicase Cas3